MCLDGHGSNDEHHICIRGQRMLCIRDRHALGLNVAKGLMLTETFYWGLNDQTRAWSRRFASANSGKMPSMVQAGVYSSVIHYLKAVEAAKTDDGTKVAETMKELPTDCPLYTFDASHD